MKILLFKNGSKIKIHDIVAEQIKKRTLSKDGARQWQSFIEEETGKCVLIINLNEVSGIYANENII